MFIKKKKSLQIAFNFINFSNVDKNEFFFAGLFSQRAEFSQLHRGQLIFGLMHKQNRLWDWF